ncbi:MAG TPA: glycosyltransferase family 4 protein [Thermoplasmata archaeon]
MVYRILSCSDHLFPPRGGGDLSMRFLCRELKSIGHDVHTCYLGTLSDPEFPSHPLDLKTRARGMWPRQALIHGPWKRRIASLLRRLSPDVVFAQQTVLFSTIEACSEVSVPVVSFLHNIDPFCLGSFWNGKPWKCRYKCIGCQDAGPRIAQFPFFRKEVARAKRALPHAEAIVANSPFTQRTLREIWGLESTILTPGVEFPSQRLSLMEDGAVLYFSPVDYKGVDTAISVAELMEGQRFIFVGDAKPSVQRKLRELRNVRYHAWTEDLSELWRSTKLLMMPSIIPEGYGMVCVEAMSRGIPCAVSGIGALPETIGDGGDAVPDYHSAQVWAATIRKYDVLQYLRAKSSNAIVRAQQERSCHDLSDLLVVMDRAVAGKTSSCSQAAR